MDSCYGTMFRSENGLFESLALNKTKTQYYMVGFAS